jgi:Arc/MetJ family transcription regulator
MPRLQRTNIVIDQTLVERAKELYGLDSTRETVDFALRRLVAHGTDPYELAKQLRGSMIVPPLDEIRGETPIPEL